MADIDYLSKKGLNRYDNKVKNYIGIELTKAEYDALSEEEKNKGTYWITDYSSSGGSSNIELDKTLSIEGKAADAKAVGDTKISYTDVVDNLESTETKLPLSANQGRKMNAVITNILVTMLPIITEFEVTTGTGSGVGYAFIPVNTDISRAVVTNINRDDYIVTNVVKLGNDRICLTVIDRVSGAWADNITIKGTMILYKEY